MKPRWLPLLLILAGFAGCGDSGTWVDTTSGACLESQIEETRQRPELFVEMGTQVCKGAGKGDFAGEFRCAGDENLGTQKLQAKCKG